MASADSDSKSKTQSLGDRPTAPIGLDDGMDTWGKFVRLQTGPASLAAGCDGPSQRGHLRPDQVVSLVESTMALARRSERACPKPVQWGRLHALLPPHGDAKAPPLPVTEKEWKRIPPMQKRLLLRDHLEWAAITGVLPVVHALLEGLDENEWEHF